MPQARLTRVASDHRRAACWRSTAWCTVRTFVSRGSLCGWVGGLYSRLVMAYQSLFRKYRPQRFSDLVGQEHVVNALRSAVRDGRDQ